MHIHAPALPGFHHQQCPPAKMTALGQEVALQQGCLEAHFSTSARQDDFAPDQRLLVAKLEPQGVDQFSKLAAVQKRLTLKAFEVYPTSLRLGKSSRDAAACSKEAVANEENNSQMGPANKFKALVSTPPNWQICLFWLYIVNVSSCLRCASWQRAQSSEERLFIRCSSSAHSGSNLTLLKSVSIYQPTLPGTASRLKLPNQNGTRKNVLLSDLQQVHLPG